MPQALLLAAVILGGCLLTVGAGMVYLPLAPAVAGLLLLAFGLFTDTQEGQQ